MGSVIRLKDDVTKMLQPYGSDPNEAIRKVFVTLEGLKVAIEAVKSSNPAINTAPIRVLPGDFSSDCGINVGGTPEFIVKDDVNYRIEAAKRKFSSTPVPESGVPSMFNEAYWKKFREEVGKSIEPMVGKGY